MRRERSRRKDAGGRYIGQSYNLAVQGGGVNVPRHMSTFADHFSRVAAAYAVFRPRYPEALFDWLAGTAPGRRRAWDCGTGSGQAAVALAKRFQEVIASDPSIAQLANAERVPGVSYVAMTAERCALASSTADLITVAQALHWFDRDAFFQETMRVLRPGGLLAVWSYALMTVSPEIDSIIGTFYRDTVGPYWPPGRALVEHGYAGLQLPLPSIPAPALHMDAEWDLAQLMGYVSTWSAVDRYRIDRQEDPVPLLAGQLEHLWGDPAAPRTVRWPLTLIAARKS